MIRDTLDKKLLDILCCPKSKEPLTAQGDMLSTASGKHYPIIDGIPSFEHARIDREYRYELSVLILTLDEEQNLSILLDEIKQELSQQSQSWEIVVIDGGSQDKTQEVAKAAGARVIVQNNPGYAEAFQQGLRETQGRYIITLDGDLSHPASLIPSLYEKRNDAHIIIGSRWMPGGTFEGPSHRLYLSRLLNLIFKRLLSLPVRDISSGYRLYRSSVLTPDSYQSKDFSILEEVLVKAYTDGFQIDEIPMKFRNRKEGASHVRFLQFALSYFSTLKRMWLLRNDANGCDYDHRAFNSPVLPQLYWQRKRFQNIMELLGDYRSNGLVLDVGCGSSRIIQALPHCVAYDLSLKKLRYLKNTNPLRVSGSAFSLPFKDNTFDCVIHSQLIEHLPPADEIFTELQRVIKPGGTLIMGTVDYGDWYWPFIEKVYDFILPHAYAGEHITHYTLSSLKKRLEDAGFQTTDLRTILKGEITYKAVRSR